MAQDKGYIGLSFGAAAPIGDYGSKDTYKEEAGLAKTGTNLDLSFGYRFGKYYGIAATAKVFRNAFDTDVVLDELEHSLADEIVSVKVKADPWKASTLLIGGYGSFPISKSFRFETRALVGLVRVTSPERRMDVTFFDNFLIQPVYWAAEESANATTFAYLLGAGIKWDVLRRICLLANLEYFSSKPEFVRVKSHNSHGDRDYFTFSNKVAVVNANFGVGFRL